MRGVPGGATGSVLGALSTTDVVILVAAVVACLAAIVVLVAAVVLVGAVKRLERGVEALRGETVPLVSGARRAVDQANTDLELVGTVLESTESVTTTVDSASRLAQRAFANPFVRFLAWRAGTVAGLRQLRQTSPDPQTPGSDASEPVASTPPTPLSAHRRRSRTSTRGRRSRMAG